MPSILPFRWGKMATHAFTALDSTTGRATIAYNPDHKVAAKRTQVMVGDNRDPLTDEEKSFLQFKLDAAVLFPKPPLASIKSFIKANLKTGVFSAKSIEDAPIAITAVTAEEISQQVPVSAADLAVDEFLKAELGALLPLFDSWGVGAADDDGYLPL